MPDPASVSWDALLDAMPPIEHRHCEFGGRSQLVDQLHRELQRRGWQIVKVDLQADRRWAAGLLAMLFGFGALYAVGVVATWRFLCIG